MGVADRYSDFDFYVYTHASVPVAAREAVIARRATNYQLNNTFWELEDEWVESAETHFNSMYRDCTNAMDEIAERLGASRLRSSSISRSC
jgi:DNA-binding ferritin-like protein